MLLIFILFDLLLIFLAYMFILLLKSLILQLICSTPLRFVILELLLYFVKHLLLLNFVVEQHWSLQVSSDISNAEKLARSWSLAIMKISNNSWITATQTLKLLNLSLNCLTTSQTLRVIGMENIMITISILDSHNLNTLCHCEHLWNALKNSD